MTMRRSTTNSPEGSTSVVEVIHIHPLAPPKPDVGAGCNGCGVCCMQSPCPLGIVLSGRRHGACAALQWHEQDHVYRCGAVTQPHEVLATRMPTGLRALTPGLSWVLSRWARRWIASGQGCDCTLEVAAFPTPPRNGDNPDATGS